MKFSLIAAVVLLALAQGSFAQDAAELEKVTKFFEDLKNKVTEEVTAILNNQELTNQAQTFLQDKKTQVEPIVSQVQEHLKGAVTKIEEHITPLATDIQPMVDSFRKEMEDIFQRLVERSRAITQ